MGAICGDILWHLSAIGGEGYANLDASVESHCGCQVWVPFGEVSQ